MIDLRFYCCRTAHFGNERATIISTFDRVWHIQCTTVIQFIIRSKPFVRHKTFRGSKHSLSFVGAKIHSQLQRFTFSHKVSIAIMSTLSTIGRSKFKRNLFTYIIGKIDAHRSPVAPQNGRNTRIS